MSQFIADRPSLDLYPPVEPPTANAAQWRDIERLALYEPLAHHAVTLVYRGDLTREQALILLAFGLYDQKRGFFHREVERLNTTISDRFVITPNS